VNDQPCLFCADGHKILCESSGWYARHDNYPANPGHVEIVPRRHVESFFDLSAGEMAQACELLTRARALLAAQYRPDGWTIGVNDGTAAGRSIDHLHIHLIPRHHGDVPDPRGGIRQCVPNWAPDSWQVPDQPAKGAP
jgi:diadenosine tetraphosphate (Ap4A) HIT family hydrolase